MLQVDEAIPADLYCNDVQEGLVSEFKRMNDEVEENKRRDASFEVPESFSKRYASVLVQLDDVNDQAFTHPS